MSRSTDSPGSAVWPLLTGCLALVSVTSVCCMLASILLGSSPAALLLGSILAVAVVPAYLLFLLFLDPLEHEPVGLLALAFAWGAGAAYLGGVLVEIVLESSVEAVFGISSSTYETIDSVLVTPFVEETAKGAFLLFCFLAARHEFDDVVDGIVYGGIVGLGFTVVEDLSYYADEFLETGLAGLGLLFVARGILTSFGHILFTAVTGMAFGLAIQVRSRFLRWLLPPLGLAGAMALHGLFNGMVVLAQGDDSGVLAVLTLLGYPAFVFVPGAIGLILVALVQTRRRDREVRRFLGEAVQRGLADPADLDLLTRPWRRWRRQWEALARDGFRAFWLRRRLDSALVDWAFRRWHRERGQRLAGYLAQFEAEALENRIRRWRDELGRSQRSPGG